MTADGVVELQDLMPVSEHQRIVRRVTCVRGRMRLGSQLRARFDYARAPHRTRRNRDGVVLATDELKLTLFAGVPLQTDSGDVSAAFDVSEGETVTFVLHVGDVGDRGCHLGETAQALFDETVAYWRDWLQTSTYTGRWREMVHRSALTLKLLTYGPTGAIVAAPTTSLPEQLGGTRNWDYRYVWMRDAAFTVYALIRLGFTEEAAAFNRWSCERLADRTDSPTGPLQTMYRVDGGTEVDESELRPPCRLRGVTAGTHRQRRRRPAAARHLRRADRLDLPLRQVRIADPARHLDGADTDRRLAVRQLGSPRRRHLGEPFGAPPITPSPD